MNAAPLVESAIGLESILRQSGLEYCFIGGIAVLRWGEPRITRDLDLTVMADFGHEAVAVDRLLTNLRPRVSDAREFALLNRVLLVRDPSGTPIDIAFGAMPFEEHSVQRASAFAIDEDRFITTCSAEDLIVHKAFAGRDKDWMDIRGVVIRSDSLDWDIIESELAGLALVTQDESPMLRLAQLRKGDG